MKIDMTPILNGETSTIPFDFMYDFDGADFGDIRFDAPVHVFGKVENKSGYMFVSLNAEADFTALCARCLCDVRKSVKLHTQRDVAVTGAVSEDSEDDYVFIVDSHLDIGECTDELIFTELPSKYLCSDDCRGLCPKCGKNLNEGDCTCEKREIDPRLAVLKKLLEDNGENNN